MVGLLGVLSVLRWAGAAQPEPTFGLCREDGSVRLETASGRPVLVYVIKKPADSKLTANSVCCLHPIYTPSGVAVTDFAPDDHRHHRGVFLAWYAMHGAKDADFWGWGQFAPTKGRVIENRSVDLASADKQRAELAIKNAWLADGEVMVNEDLSAVVQLVKDAYLVDLTYTLTPTADTKLDQSAFGGFCVRSRKDGKFTFLGADGEVKLPDPHYLKPETCWPAAHWYAYTIELKDGRTVGLAMIDHPDNPPTKWHNNRGVWMLNPCITAPGPITLKKGQPFVLRYSLVVFDGALPTELVKKLATTR
jgi:hypothetical protein